MKSIKIYKRKGLSGLILWEKTYYNNSFLGGTKKEDWEGILFLYRFLILKGESKNRFLIEPLIEDFRGKNKKEMVGFLLKRLRGLKEWKLEGKHYRDADFFPIEVDKKLKELKLQKYVKKLS